MVSAESDRVLWCSLLSPPGPAADRHGQRGERNAGHCDPLFGSAARRRDLSPPRCALRLRAHLPDPLTDVLATLHLPGSPDRYSDVLRAVPNQLNGSIRQTSLCPWQGTGTLAVARDTCNPTRRRNDVPSGAVEIE